MQALGLGAAEGSCREGVEEGAGHRHPIPAHCQLHQLIPLFLSKAREQGLALFPQQQSGSCSGHSQLENPCVGSAGREKHLHSLGAPGAIPGRSQPSLP